MINPELFFIFWHPFISNAYNAKQGNVFFEETYEDDGDKKDSGVGEFEQKIEVKGNDLPRNVYYITFTRDDNNKWEDSTIKDIRVNSNKVLILGTILPIEGFEFYTEIEGNEEIEFMTRYS